METLNTLLNKTCSTRFMRLGKIQFPKYLFTKEKFIQTHNIDIRGGHLVAQRVNNATVALVEQQS